MATTYTVTAEFSVTTEVEPEFRGFGLNTDYDDGSYFGSDSATCSGGSITFKVEADDEEDADRKAEEVIYSGMEITDDNGLTWEVDDVSFEIEADEVPMDKERAIKVIESFLDYELQSGRIDAEQKEAFEFMLAYVSGMTT